MAFPSRRAALAALGAGGTLAVAAALIVHTSRSLSVAPVAPSGEPATEPPSEDGAPGDVAAPRAVVPPPTAEPGSSANTTTSNGLRVQAAADTRPYEKDIRVSDDELAAISLKPDKFHGECGRWWLSGGAVQQRRPKG